MGIEITRFDMSEYMERHTVSRLIGAPPGYVGFDQGGLLTDAIDQHPHSVLLLDEIEKAHPDLFNILLQIMDYGKLTDHNGKTVDFRNVILIMTTNAGAAELAKQAIGFGSGIRTGHDEEAINRMFTPEFRNRLDATISFAALSPETIGRVVDKFVLQLEEQLADRNVTIELDAAARDWLAEKGYDPLFGARPLAARHPGAHQEAARRGAAVRRAGEGRHRPGVGRQGGRQAGLHLPAAPAGDPGRAERGRTGRVERIRSDPLTSQPSSKKTRPRRRPGAGRGPLSSSPDSRQLGPGLRREPILFGEFALTPTPSHARTIRSRSIH